MTLKQPQRVPKGCRAICCLSRCEVSQLTLDSTNYFQVYMPNWPSHNVGEGKMALLLLTAYRRKFYFI